MHAKNREIPRRVSGRFKRYIARLGALALLAVFAPAAANAGGNPLIGNWARNDGGTRIRIVSCGANLCATNTWVRDPNGGERVGDELILSLTPGADAQYSGQGFDVRRQMKFRMTITVKATAMHTSGCVLLGVVCKTADWHKQSQ